MHCSRRPLRLIMLALGLAAGVGTAGAQTHVPPRPLTPQMREMINTAQANRFKFQQAAQQQRQQIQAWQKAHPGKKLDRATAAAILKQHPLPRLQTLTPPLTPAQQQQRLQLIRQLKAQQQQNQRARHGK
jgi:dihydrodipicolinate synthase/N-acetylneuraminate lyase